jgi:hypothetical protein
MADHFIRDNAEFQEARPKRNRACVRRKPYNTKEIGRYGSSSAQRSVAGLYKEKKMSLV